MSKIRPVELGMPLVRVANNGISGIINPFGKEILKSKASQSLQIRKFPNPYLWGGAMMIIQFLKKNQIKNPYISVRVIFLGILCLILYCIRCS